MTRYIAILCAAAALSACSLFTEAQPGLTEFDMAADGTVALNSGKEYASFRGCMVRPDGTMAYIEATGVEAFKGQEILLAMQAQQLAFIEGLVNKLMAAAGGGMPGPMMVPRAVEPAPPAADPCTAAFAQAP